MKGNKHVVISANYTISPFNKETLYSFTKNRVGVNNMPYLGIGDTCPSQKLEIK